MMMTKTRQVRLWCMTLAVLSLSLTTAVVSSDEDQCRLYLAESSTSTADEPKWGLYAGVDYEKGDVIQPTDLAIQTFDLMGNNRAEDEDDETYLQSIVQFFEQFIWVPDCSGGKWELEEGRCVTAIPGPGVLGGFNAKLTNTDWDHGLAYSREALGEQPGVAHPGRGASTHFFNVGLRSKDVIASGSEIFLDYGENWSDDDDDEEDEESELTKIDYQKIDVMVEQMIEFLDKYKDELTETSKAEIYDFLIKDVMGAAAGAKKGRKITSLLPQDPDDLHKVSEAGGALMYSVPSSKRSEDWLKTNGRCMDKVEAKASTLPHAGRGGFATRAIAKGDLVAPVPLIHIPDKTIMDMHNVQYSDDEEDPFRHRTDDEVIGSQLLLNYCYGHPESSMLFFPSGSGALFINHSKEKVNAKLVWSEHPDHKTEWYDMDPADLVEAHHQYMGLMLEVVATKDIAAGDEIFLDYGDEWDAAWDQHVIDFESKVADGEIVSPWPIRAIDLNEEYRTKPHKTEEEAEEDPYPTNVLQKCFLTTGTKLVEDAGEDDTANQTVKYWKPTKKTATFNTDNLFDCKVKSRTETDDGSYIYTVAWLDKYGEEEEITEVPHKAITFLDKPGTSDQFFHEAFRHSIGIPDDIFPDGPWRNLV